MIYDCFTFFNELDVLEIRLNVLNDIVDKFVIVEATKTHSGNDKELVFAANRDRFREFEDKIIYIVPETYPEFKTSWTYENYQRNCIAQGLAGCDPHDTILISDCDEIPNPRVVRELAGTSGVKILEQFMFFYFINYLDVGDPIWIGGTRIMDYAYFQHGLDGVRVKYNDYLIRELNPGTTATKLRLWKYARRIANGGWHFSFLGGVDAIVRKIKSYSHQELNRDELLDAQTILRKIEDGRDLFDRRGHEYKAVSLDEYYPPWLLAHREKFSKFIAPESTDSLRNYMVRRTFWGDFRESIARWRHMRRKER